MRERKQHMQQKQKMIKESRQRKIAETNKRVILDFIKLFRDLNNREPIETEIIDNLKDKIDAEVIRDILLEHTSSV